MCYTCVFEVDLKKLFQVESIVLSIISMLSSPNDESPANVEAAVSFKFKVLFSLSNLFPPILSAHSVIDFSFFFLGLNMKVSFLGAGVWPWL